MSANLITDQWMTSVGIYGKFKARFACLPDRLLVNLGLRAPSLFFLFSIIMARTKSTLGRVLARYYNWYGMTGKLRATLSQLERNKKVSEVLRITYKTNAISEAGKRNSSNP